jgi:hypothetical protein
MAWYQIALLILIGIAAGCCVSMGVLLWLGGRS